jgi:hypothetical protein
MELNGSHKKGAHVQLRSFWLCLLNSKLDLAHIKILTFYLRDFSHIFLIMHE